MSYWESQFLLGTPTHLCTKSRGLESLHPSLIDFWLQWTRRRRTRGRPITLLVEETSQLITQLSTGCTFARFHLLQFYIVVLIQKPQTTARQPEACSRAHLWSKQMPCFSTDPKHNKLFYRYIFYGKGRLDFKKKKSLKKKVFKQFNKGARGRSP